MPSIPVVFEFEFEYVKQDIDLFRYIPPAGWMIINWGFTKKNIQNSIHEAHILGDPDGSNKFISRVDRGGAIEINIYWHFTIMKIS